MPGIDGITASKAIKSRSPDAQVVLMTAYSSPEDLAAAVDAGVANVLSKPLDLPSLFSILTTDGHSA
jgi:two-component system response regulator AtoC